VNTYIGTVVAIHGQQARVKIEQKPGEQRPKQLDCWNACEAKRGMRVLVERQEVEAGKAKLIARGIPVLTAVAGAAFGRAMAHFFPLPQWQVVLGSTVIWLLLGWNYARNFRKVVNPRGAQWTVTGYYSDGMIPGVDDPVSSEEE